MRNNKNGKAIRKDGWPCLLLGGGGQVNVYLSAHQDGAGELVVQIQREFLGQDTSHDFHFALIQVGDLIAFLYLEQARHLGGMLLHVSLHETPDGIVLIMGEGGADFHGDILRDTQFFHQVFGEGFDVVQTIDVDGQDVFAILGIDGSHDPNVGKPPGARQISQLLHPGGGAIEVHLLGKFHGQDFCDEVFEVHAGVFAADLLQQLAQPVAVGSAATLFSSFQNFFLQLRRVQVQYREVRFGSSLSDFHRRSSSNSAFFRPALGEFLEGYRNHLVQADSLGFQHFGNFFGNGNSIPLETLLQKRAVILPGGFDLFGFQGYVLTIRELHCVFLLKIDNSIYLRVISYHNIAKKSTNYVNKIQDCLISTFIIKYFL